MLNLYWKKISTAINVRTKQERALLLLAVIAVPVYAWWVVIFEPGQTDQVGIERRVAVVSSQIVQEKNRQEEIRASYSVDPNVFARTKLDGLRTANAEADTKLNELYGQLISPREMSLMLSRLLQSETKLDLISLQNKTSELLLTSAFASATDAVSAGSKIELYKHGMQMTFEGDYMETIRFLRSLERLQNNFFWETLDYSVTEYPNARIILDIYTLSTEQGWIGV